jgi:hypothetical protein
VTRATHTRIDLAFNNLGFVRPTINQFVAARDLGKLQPTMGDILARPKATPCPRPGEELLWSDVVNDDDDEDGGGADGDGWWTDDASKSVPINRRQFDAIKQVGRERLVLIQVTNN